MSAEQTSPANMLYWSIYLNSPFRGHVWWTWAVLDSSIVAEYHLLLRSVICDWKMPTQLHYYSTLLHRFIQISKMSQCIALFSVDKKEATRHRHSKRNGQHNVVSRMAVWASSPPLPSPTPPQATSATMQCTRHSAIAESETVQGSQTSPAMPQRLSLSLFLLLAHENEKMHHVHFLEAELAWPKRCWTSSQLMMFHSCEWKWSAWIRRKGTVYWIGAMSRRTSTG